MNLAYIAGVLLVRTELKLSKHTESCLKLHYSLHTLVVRTADLKVSKHIEFIYNYLIVLDY